MSRRRTEAAEAPHREWPLAFAEVLAVAAGAAVRKSERTRLRLLAAVAANLAGGRGFEALRVADVVAAASLAHGTFYRYFPTLPAAVEATVGAFAQHLAAVLAEARGGAPGTRRRVEAATLAYVRLVRANPGLMRCLLDPSPAAAGFRAHFQALNRAWNGRVAEALARRRRGARRSALLARAYALGGMVDEFLAQLYVRPDPALTGLARDEAAVARLLSELWWLGAYGRLPRTEG